MWIFSIALASTFSGMDLQTVDVGFGPMQKRLAYGLCYARYLRVGTVVSTRPFLKPVHPGSDAAQDVFTAITFRTDATIRGPRAGEFEIVVRGGPYQGTWYPVSRDDPQPKVGTQYILAYHTLGTPPPGTPQVWPLDHKVVTATLSVEPGSELPTVEEIKAVLYPACKAKMPLGRR